MMGGAMMGGPPPVNEYPMQQPMQQPIDYPMAGGVGPQGLADGSGEIMQTNYAQCGPDGCGPAMGGGMHGGGTYVPPGGGVLQGGMMMPMAPPTVQVTFGSPESMRVRYDASGGGMFDSEPLIVPARQNQQSVPADQRRRPSDTRSAVASAVASDIH
jgi:hypothetical protein